jgi:hypothetical protein
VRRDDFAALFVIHAGGGIDGAVGPEQDRARWNITLLNLDHWDKYREEVLSLLATCEEAFQVLDQEVPARIFEKLLPILARRFLFFEVFGIQVSDGLRERVQDMRRKLQAGER